MMNMSKANRSEPLKRAAFHILLALAREDSYGYAIMQTVREQSGGRVPLQTGSLYRHLGKLIEAGLIAENDAASQSGDARRGAYYHLTDAGREVLEIERQHLASVVAELQHVGPPAGSERR